MEKAAILERELFSSSEYIARNRTNEEFLEDVFESHLFRGITPQEKSDWVDYLNSLPPSYTQQRKRMRLINEFEGRWGFEEAILGIVDEELPAEPTPTP